MLPDIYFLAGGTAGAIELQELKHRSTKKAHIDKLSIPLIAQDLACPERTFTKIVDLGRFTAIHLHAANIKNVFPKRRRYSSSARRMKLGFDSVNRKF